MKIYVEKKKLFLRAKDEADGGRGGGDKKITKISRRQLFVSEKFENRK